MAHPDGDAAGWRSDEDVAAWIAASEEREERRRGQRRLMADLLPFGEDEPFLFVDLGAGTGAASRVILERHPAATALLADWSPQMAAAGARALAPFAGRYRYVDFDLAGGPWPDGIPERVDAVVTSMCLHHLPHARQAQLCAEAFARLAPGGWFLDFDVVAAGDPGIAAAWDLAARREPDAGLQHPHHAQDGPHGHAAETLFLSPLPRLLGFLADAGFESVDVFWKQLDTVLVGGRRPR
jgi:tRNA (cmo5U34)-methyltransferase